MEFGYDIAGRRQNVSRANGATTYYSYDGLSRLTQLQQYVNGPQDLIATFVYNPASRLKSRTASITLYEPTSQASGATGYGVNGLKQVTTSGGLSLTYSARGNTTSDGVNS